MNKLHSVSWSGNLYELLCLYFGLEPTPRIFKKLLKIPMPVLRRINIRIVIYLDDILIMGQTMDESLMSRDTAIFLLQHLGFVLNLEKSILNPLQEIEFLGVTMNSLKMYLSLPPEVLKIQSQCQNIHSKGHATVHKLAKLLGLLASTIQATVSSDEFSITSATANKSVERN